MTESTNKLKVDNLYIEIHPDRISMGQTASSAIAKKIRSVLAKQNEIRMLFAAAPSQNEVLEALVHQDGIDWKKISAFHVDEYIGLSSLSPQRFGYFLKEKIFDRVPFKKVHYLNPKSTNAQDECKRYTRLLMEAPIDIICMGIGENGHIAFNDPPVANFSDPEMVKVIELDQACRQQQVNDGCFDNLNDVPKQAITLTVPMLFSGKYLFVVVPGKSKAKAVYCTLNSKVSTSCPASVLRQHTNAVLYLDTDSASELKGSFSN